MDANQRKISSCLACTRRSEIFDQFTESELKIIDENRCEVQYKAGEIIFKQGTRTTQLLSVNSGLAKVYIEGKNNKNLIIVLIKPTNFLGGPGIYLDNIHHFSVAAVEDLNCCIFDPVVFRKIAKKNIHVSDKMAEFASRKSLHYMERLYSLTQKQVFGRMADILFYLHNSIYNSNPMKLTVTKQDLAEMTAMNKDTVVRVLKEMENDKVISVNSNSVKIIDFDKLKNLSENG